MEKAQRHPPKWWIKIIKDIEKIVTASKRAFNRPGVVIGNSINKDSVVQGIIVRLENGEAGYYTIENNQRAPKIGSQIKLKLPEPEVIVKEPEFHLFVFEMIHEQIKLIPLLWLNKILLKMTKNEPITMKDLKPFPEWIRLPLHLKKDKALIDILYRVTKYEGLRGLERFNDYAS